MTIWRVQLRGFLVKEFEERTGLHSIKLQEHLCLVFFKRLQDCCWENKPLSMPCYYNLWVLWDEKQSLYMKKLQNSKLQNTKDL